jgi:hypothetical protein
VYLRQFSRADLESAARDLGIAIESKDAKLRRAVACAYRDKDRLLARVELLPKDARDVFLIACVRGRGRQRFERTHTISAFTGLDERGVTLAESVLQSACLVSTPERRNSDIDFGIRTLLRSRSDAWCALGRPCEPP